MDSSRRGDVGNALYKWLSSLLHKLGEGRREDTFSILPLRRPDFRSHFTRWHRNTMLMAIGVRQQTGKFRRILRVVAIPDIVQQPLAGLKGALFTRDSVSRLQSVLTVPKPDSSVQKHVSRLVVEVVAANAEE